MSQAHRGVRGSTRFAIASAMAAILFGGTTITPATVQPVRAAGDFQLLVTPDEQLLPPGGSVSFLVQVGSIGGFADPVALTVGSLPDGVTSQLSNDVVTPPATVNLTLIASDDAEVGLFPIVVTGTSGVLTHTASGSVTVDFGLVPICYARIQGTVTDATTGAPIAGVAISVGPDVATDDQGRYSFDMVGLGDNNAPVTTSVLARKEGYWSTVSEEASFVCAQETTVDLTMLAQIKAAAHGRIVEGTVDPNDPDVVVPGQTPIAGITAGFDICCIPGSGPDTSGADGTFAVSLDHLGEGNTPLFGMHMFAQEPVNFTDQVYWPRGASTPSPIPIGDVAPGDDVDVGDIGLVRKCFGSVSGTLTYGDSGQPAAGVSVTAQSSSHNTLWWFSSATTDATGAFDVPVISLGYNNQPADVHVYATDPSGFYVTAESTTRFEACGDARIVPLVFQPILLGSLGGGVTDEDTGQPLPGATVGFRFSSCPTCDPYPAIADGLGTYRIDRIPAAEPPAVAGYSAEANHPGYWWTIHPVEIRPGMTTQQDFALLRMKFASLRGRVTDAITGLPIEGASGGATHDGSATTLPDGTYAQSGLEIGYRNAPLDGSVRFGAAGYWPAQVPATFAADAETVVDLELIPICDGATIRGRVVDATNQQPLEGAAVTVFGAGQDLTDPSGRYEIADIPVGDNNSPASVTVFASKEGYFSQQKSITVFCGASISIDFGRRPVHTGALEGFVTNAVTGDPIAGVTIVGEFGEQAITDPTGHYLFPEVPVGDDGSPRSWAVSALPVGFAQQTKPVTVRADETARLDFQFGAIAPATGRIVVKVTTEPSASGQAFSFTPSYGPAFLLTDGGTRDSGPLAAGSTYSVTQTIVAGWDLTASCDGGQSPGSIALAADTIVTCTFTNVQQGSIVVRKSANGGDGTFRFTSPDLGGFSIMTTAGVGEATFPGLAPGSFAVAESVTSGWDLRSASCSDGDVPAAITLAAGQTVICTFLNDKRGSASIRKTVGGSAPSGSQTFAFQLRQGASPTAPGTVLASVAASAANGGVAPFGVELVAGADYQACEFVMPGWRSSLGPDPFVPFDLGGDNSVLCATFTVEPGEARVLSIDNSPPPGGLTRTIGFWKNWSSCSKGKQAPVLDRTLAKAEPAGVPMGRLILHGTAARPDVAQDCAKALNLLDKTTIDGKKKSASDPAFNMAAQLLAAKLNRLAEAETCAAVATAIVDGQALLDAVAFDGLTHGRMTAQQSARANALAMTLDRYNNGLLC